MNRELALLIQSYLDGELAGRKARRVADWLETDGEAQALYQALNQTRELLHGDVELERNVEESREFYWSQLEKRIAQVERERPLLDPPVAGGWLLAWRRYAAPLAAAALMMLLAIPAGQYLVGDRGDPYLAELAEVENPIEEIGSYSFRTESGMFVVWLYDRAPDLTESAEETQVIFQ